MNQSLGPTLPPVGWQGGRLLVNEFRLCIKTDAEVILCKRLEIQKESVSQISIGEKAWRAVHMLSNLDSETVGKTV